MFHIVVRSFDALQEKISRISLKRHFLRRASSPGPRPAKALHCEGEGGLNNDDAKAQLLNPGAELRARAPGQRANAAEAWNGALRVVLRATGEQLLKTSLPYHDRAPPC